MSGAVGSVFDGMYLHGSREFAIHPTNPGGGKASRVSDAFEGGAAPKMVTLLKGQDLNLRREAMFSMVRYTKANPKNIVKCVEAGAVKCLVEHLSDRDAVLRRHACKLLSLLSGTKIGLEDVLYENGIAALLAHLDDADAQCRQEVYSALVELTRHPEGAKKVHEARGIPALVKKCRVDVYKEIEPLVLQTLHQCLNTDESQMEALLIDGMVVMTKLLTRETAEGEPDNVIRTWAAKNIQQLSIAYAAKPKVIESGALRELGKLLRCDDKELKLAATNALMSASIDIKAKQICLEMDAVAPLIKDLSDYSNGPQIIASIKTLENIAEQSRPMVSDALTALIALESDHPSGLIRKYATDCIAMIRWSP
jgi:hypothetical protein